MGLGTKVLTLRMASEQSLQDVAESVGASKAHIWEIEKGRTNNPAMSLVTRLADHFNVSISYLVDEDIEADERDVDLQRMFRQAHELDPYERRLLDDMLQALRKRSEDRQVETN